MSDVRVLLARVFIDIAAVLNSAALISAGAARRLLDSARN